VNVINKVHSELFDQPPSEFGVHFWEALTARGILRRSLQLVMGTMRLKKDWSLLGGTLVARLSIPDTRP